jgi:hypothetical protein
MGRKALEEIGKVLLVSIISIILSVTLTARKFIDKKLDKEEYRRDKAVHAAKHTEEKQDYIYLHQELIRQMEQQNRDIKEIRVLIIKSMQK